MPLPILGAAAISAGAGLASSVLGGLLQNSSAADRQKLAYWQQRELNEQQYQHNLSLSKTMFDYEYSKNSPLAQIQRFRQAGINPYVAASQGIGQAETSVGAPSVQGGSAPPPAPVANLFSGVPQATAQLADAFYTLSKTKGQDIENQYQKQSLESRLRALGLQIDNQEIQNSIAQLQLQADQISKIPQAKFAVDAIEKELLNMDLKNQNLTADTLLKMADREFTIARTKMTNKEREQLEKAMPFYIQQLKETVGLIIQQQNTEKSKQAQNYAAADASKAQAAKDRAITLTTNLTRDFDVAFADNRNYEQFNKAKISRKDYERSVRTFEATVSAADYANQAVLSTIDMVTEQATLLAKENKYYELKLLLDASATFIKAASKNSSDLGKAMAK